MYHAHEAFMHCWPIGQVILVEEDGMVVVNELIDERDVGLCNFLEEVEPPVGGEREAGEVVAQFHF
jgi:hypothetical protein